MAIYFKKNLFEAVQITAAWFVPGFVPKIEGVDIEGVVIDDMAETVTLTLDASPLPDVVYVLVEGDWISRYRDQSPLYPGKYTPVLEAVFAEFFELEV